MMADLPPPQSDSVSDSDKFLELNFRDETDQFRKMRRNEYGEIRERGRNDFGNYTRYRCISGRAVTGLLIILMTDEGSMTNLLHSCLAGYCSCGKFNTLFREASSLESANCMNLLMSV